MSRMTIPEDVKASVLETVEQFNRRELARTGFYYLARFQGKYLYLDRADFGKVGPICRLEYKGDGQPWSFAIYKYSSDHYDAKERWFPGSEHVNGTVEGALKAGMEAYQ